MTDPPIDAAVAPHPPDRAAVGRSWRRFRSFRAPLAIRRFEVEMQRGLGSNYLAGVPDRITRPMRPTPIVFADLFRGLEANDAVVSHGIRFAEPDGQRLTLTVYRPNGDGHFPAIVQIYGGAWQRGTPEDQSELAPYLAARGYVVFAIDYRHAPRWQWPAQIADVRIGARLDSRARDELQRGRDPPRPGRTIRGSTARAARGVRAERAADTRRRELATVRWISWRGIVTLRNPTRSAFARSKRPCWAALPIRCRGDIARPPPSPTSRDDFRRRCSSTPGAITWSRRASAACCTSACSPPERRRCSWRFPGPSTGSMPCRAGPSGQVSLYYTERFLAWALTRD